jgi:hypothetical protein
MCKALPLIGCFVGALAAQEIAPICAPKSPGLAFNCWRDKAKPAAQTDPVAAGVRAARDAGIATYRASIPNPFPVNASDLVAVVTFSDFIPRMPASGQAIYTELIFKVNDVLRQAGVKVANGDSLTSILPGGAIRLENGKTVRNFPDGADDLPLHPGGRYLVFLKYRPQTDSYEFLKHWGLSNGRLVITDLDEMGRASLGYPSIRPDTRETDVVEQIRQGKL